MTFLFCSAPLMYFDKQGSDLHYGIAAHHCTLPCPPGTILSPQTLKLHHPGLMFHTMPLNLCCHRAQKEIKPPAYSVVLLKQRLVEYTVRIFLLNPDSSKANCLWNDFFLRCMFPQVEPKHCLTSQLWLSNTSVSLSLCGCMRPASAPAVRCKASIM